MEDNRWSVLIVDDEPPIRAELRYLLGQDVRVGRIEEAGSGSEAVEHILADRPDVLFLDIQMPGTSGIRLAETLCNLKTPPVLVFVTAFAEYAAEAFELDALDYVLKPVEIGRLQKTLDKVAGALASRRPESAAGRTMRLSVERRGKRAFIPVEDIACIEAKADYASATTADGTYLVSESISSLERRLEPQGFMRVHRSFLVNLDDVHDIEVSRSGHMELRLDRVGLAIPVSRRRAAEVKARLGLA